MCASEEMPHRYRSKRNARAASASSAAWIAMIVTPQARYSGALAMPSKLLCDASTATTPISSALEIGAAPGKRASGVCATTRPANVASRIVHVVAEIMPEVGSRVATSADATATNNAALHQSSTASGVAGPLGAATVAVMSALERARVHALNAGASR